MVNSRAQWTWSVYTLSSFILLAMAQPAIARNTKVCVQQVEGAKAVKQEIALNQQFSSIFDLKQVVVAAQDDELLQMKKQRFNSALDELQRARLLLAAGNSSLDLVLDAGKRVLQAGIEVFDDPNEQIKLHSSFLAVTKFCEGVAAVRVETAGWHRNQLRMARYYRLEAEVQLAKAKETIESKPPK